MDLAEIGDANSSKAPDTLGSRGSLRSSAFGLRSLFRRDLPSGRPLSVPPVAVVRVEHVLGWIGVGHSHVAIWTWIQKSG